MMPLLVALVTATATVTTGAPAGGEAAEAVELERRAGRAPTWESAYELQWAATATWQRVADARAAEVRRHLRELELFRARVAELERQLLTRPMMPVPAPVCAAPMSVLEHIGIGAAVCVVCAGGAAGAALLARPD